MFKRVLIALQTEAEASGLAALARELAVPQKAAVLVLHVRRVDPESADRAEDGEQIVAAGRRAALSLGLRAESELLTVDRDRHLGRAIADVALGWRADVIVMGSRRLSDLAAALHGSVSHEVIRLGSCPVVIAGEGFSGADTILLAVDGSAASLASEELVARLAQQWGARVAVVHVPQPIVVGGMVGGDWYAPAPEQDDVCVRSIERLWEAGVAAHAVELTLYPPVATAIARAAESVGADLVVLGSRGLGDLAALVRGSVSHDLLHRTKRPVLVTRGPGPSAL